MDAEEFSRIRLQLGMSRKEYGRALGFAGTGKTIFKKIMAIEYGYETIGPVTAEMARALAQPQQGRPN